MRSLNKHEIIGYVGSNPEIRETESTVIANLSVATNEIWTDKKTQEKKENTEWHKVVVFGKTAEIVRDYIEKGAHVYISGSVRTNKWEDADKNEHSDKEIIANEMIMLGDKK